MQFKAICKAAVSIAAFGLLATPAFADDCAPVIAAMTASAKVPSSSTITQTSGSAKPVISHMVQTPKLKYVETNGQWRSMNITTQETLDMMHEMLKTAKMTCHRTGTEAVGGQAATTYTVHVENEGTTSDGKLWVSAKNLQLKSEMSIGGTHYVTTANYDHVQIPPNAKPMGQ